MVELLGDGGADRIASDRNAPAEHAVGFDEDQIRGASSDIDQERAPFGPGVIVTESVVDSHGSHIDCASLNAPLLHSIAELGQLLCLHGDEKHVPVSVSLPSHDLVVPDDLIDRERHILLRLEADDCEHIIGSGAWKLDETREDRLRGQAEVDSRLERHMQPLAKRFDGRGDLGRTRRIGDGINKKNDLFNGVEPEPPVGKCAELGQTHCLHSEVEGVDAGWLCHGEDFSPSDQFEDLGLMASK